jgi:8-oxo-dGTP pyrophosphatase MutT (NUDIX family)
MYPLLRAIYILNRWRWRITRPLTVGVRLILVENDAVTLVKHTYQDRWYLPGGGVGRGETLEAAVRREAAEELGAVLGPLRLFGVYSNFYEYKSDHIAVFCCDDFALNGAASREIERVARFPLNLLPGDISPGSLRRIREYCEGAGQPIVNVW